MKAIVALFFTFFTIVASAQVQHNNELSINIGQLSLDWSYSNNYSTSIRSSFTKQRASEYIGGWYMPNNSLTKSGLTLPNLLQLTKRVYKNFWLRAGVSYEQYELNNHGVRFDNSESNSTMYIQYDNYFQKYQSLEGALGVQYNWLNKKRYSLYSSADYLVSTWRSNIKSEGYSMGCFGGGEFDTDHKYSGARYYGLAINTGVRFNVLKRFIANYEFGMSTSTGILPVSRLSVGYTF